MNRPLWFATALGCLSACSTPMAQLKTDLGPRASSELRCTEDKLTYQELDKLITTTKVKITGCQRSAIYEMVESRWRQTNDDSVTAEELRK